MLLLLLLLLLWICLRTMQVKFSIIGLQQTMSCSLSSSSYASERQNQWERRLTPWQRVVEENRPQALCTHQRTDLRLLLNTFPVFQSPPQEQKHQILIVLLREGKRLQQRLLAVIGLSSFDVMEQLPTRAPVYPQLATAGLGCLHSPT